MQTVARQLSPIFQMAERISLGRLIRPETGAAASLLELKKFCSNKGRFPVSPPSSSYSASSDSATFSVVTEEF
jgi:hypothetical protein